MVIKHIEIHQNQTPEAVIKGWFSGLNFLIEGRADIIADITDYLRLLQSILEKKIQLLYKMMFSMRGMCFF